MLSTRLLTALVAAALCACPAVFSQTILTFDIAGLAPCAPLPQNYGDNVTAPVSGAFSYGGNGFTPDVVAEYEKVSIPAGTAGLDWAGGQALVCSLGGIQSALTLTAANGIQVELLAFDLVSGFPGALNIQEVRVSNPLTSATLFVQNNVAIPPNATVPFTFSAPLTAPSIEIRLTIPFGGIELQAVAFDNVHFSQNSGVILSQANTPQASLMVNGSGTAGAPGPFAVSVPSGGTLDLLWSGPPQAPLILAVGPISQSGLFLGGAGVLHVGTPPLFNDVLIAFNGLLPTFPNALFHLDPSGTAQQSFSVPGPTTTVGMQGVVVQPGGGVILTAGFSVTFN